MLNAVTKLFAMLTALFSGGEHFANAVSILGKYAEDAAKDMAETEAMKRQIQHAKVRAELALQNAASTAVTNP